MFAFEIPGQRFSMPAGADIMRHRFVTVDESSNAVYATEFTPVVGVSMNQAKAGEVLEIADGIVMVEVGSYIPAGNHVEPNPEGKAIAAEGRTYMVALTEGNAGELIAVKL